MARLVQNVALGQLRQFVVTLALFFAQDARNRIDAVQLLGSPVGDIAVGHGLDPFPDFSDLCRCLVHLLGEQAGQQIAIVKRGRVAEQIAVHPPARCGVGVQPDKQGAAVGAADRFRLQSLLDAVFGHVAAHHLGQNLQGQGLVLGHGKGFRHAKADLPRLQGVQNRGGQRGQRKAAVNMRLGLAEAAGDGGHVCACLLHPAIGTDFIGGCQVLAGGVLGAGPCPRGGLVGGDADGNGGQFRVALGHGRITLDCAGDGAEPAAPGDDADAAIRIDGAGQVLDQADHSKAVGQQVDPLRVRILTRVHVGDIELGQREILDGGGGDDFGFHGWHSCLRRLCLLVPCPL